MRVLLALSLMHCAVSTADPRMNLCIQWPYLDLAHAGRCNATVLQEFTSADQCCRSVVGRSRSSPLSKDHEPPVPCLATAMGGTSLLTLSFSAGKNHGKVAPGQKMREAFLSRVCFTTKKTCIRDPSSHRHARSSSNPASHRRTNLISNHLAGGYTTAAHANATGNPMSAPAPISPPSGPVYHV